MPKMEIVLPEFVLLLLVGPSGSGKTTFANHHFSIDRVVSQRQIQNMLGDDGQDPALQEDAWKWMLQAIEIRLRHRKACVVDADLLTQESRKELIRLARKYHCKVVAVVLEISPETCIHRNGLRADGDPGSHLVRTQIGHMAGIQKRLMEEGIKSVHTLGTDEEAKGVEVRLSKMRSNKRHDLGPFDIIGDVHGCFDELWTLLGELGYLVEIVGTKFEEAPNFKVSHPEGRRLVFVGDLVDRGPDSPRVLRLVMDAVNAHVARCVPGNHDDKLLRHLRGNKVQLRHGLEKTVAQLEMVAPAYLEEVQTWIDRLSSHLELDGGSLIVAHAGLKATMHGRSSGEVHAFCLYGETTGETDQFGLPVRHNWAGEYEGKALVVYGHTPVPEPVWQKNTVNIDTGCVFGGRLTALRYPEREIVSVPALQVHSEPLRPLHWNMPKAAEIRLDEAIPANLLNDRALVSTRHGYHLTLNEQQVATTAEFVGTETVDPKWLVYLPPTLSPPTSSTLPGLLEHPAQATDYYRKKNLVEAVAWKQPIGTKVVMVICKNENAARKRFGAYNAGHGTIFTGSGRPFWGNTAQTEQAVAGIAAMLEAADVWKELRTDWICMEAIAVPQCEKNRQVWEPWYSKLTRSAKHGLDRAHSKLLQAQARGLQMEAEIAQALSHQQALERFGDLARSLRDQSHAPARFVLSKIIATEGTVHAELPFATQHVLVTRLALAAPDVLVPFEARLFATDSETSSREIVAWWESIDGEPVEGLVIQPNGLVHEKKVDLVQSALKVRTPAFLRLIYGPAFDAPEQLEQLRERSLKLKRETAVREYSLGIEAISRFVERRNWHDVFQCTFTILGMETGTMDPRL